MLVLPSYAQTHVNNPVDELLHQGHLYWQAGTYDSAYVAYRQAQSTARQMRLKEDWAAASFQIGKYFARTSQQAEAQKILDSVLSVSDDIGGLHSAILLSRRELASIDLELDQFEKAIQSLEELVKDCERLPADQDSIRAMCYNTLGHAYLSYENYEKALEAYETAMRIRKQFFPPGHIEIAYSENAMGMIHGYLDHYDQSLTHYLNAESIFSQHFPPEHPNLVQIRTNIAIFYADLGQFWKSLSFHKKNLPYLNNLPPGPRMGVMINLASMLIMVRDYEEALNYFQQVEDLVDQYEVGGQETRAYIADERAKIYRDLDQYDLALQYVNESMRIYQDLFGAEHSRLISLHMRKGLVLAWFDKHEQAIEAYEQALDLLDLHNERRSIRRGQTLEYLGETLIGHEAYDRAFEVLSEAENIYENSEAKWNLIGTYLKKVLVYQAWNQAESCIQMLQQAWRIIIPDLPYSPQPSDEILRYWQSHDLKDLLEVQARTYHWQYSQSQDIHDLQSAFACYEAAIAVVDSQRHYYATTSSKQAAVQYQLPMYDAAIGIAFNLYQRTQDDQFASRAWLLAERSKANTLRDHVRSMQALNVAGIPDSLLKREQQLRQRLAAQDQSFLPETDIEGLDHSTMDESYIELRREYQDFLTTIEQSYPRYYQLKYSDQSYSAETFAHTLQEGQVMYSYFLGQDVPYVFRMLKGDIQMFRISEDSKLEQLLSQWIQFVSSPSTGEQEISGDHARLGHSLFQLLLPELPEGTQQLLILPDQMLGYLPFETLLTISVSEGKRQFRELPYLGKQYSVSYAHAAELWLQQLTHASPREIKYLGIAPDFGTQLYGESIEQLSALTHNQEEVKSVAAFMGGDVLIGEQASESALKSLISDTRILHFATHARTNESSRLPAAIFLHPDPDHREDGILSEKEIYGLQLNSPLIVLSACQTGMGPILKGEGLMSLARAFQYAGGQRILTTLWRIDDLAAANLSRTFFQHLAQDMPVEQALHLSRKEWLDQSDNYHCHPYFWAGFVLIGDGGTIGGNSAHFWPPPLLFWLFIVFLLLGFIMFVRIKKS